MEELWVSMRWGEECVNLEDLSRLMLLCELYALVEVWSLPNIAICKGKEGGFTFRSWMSNSLTSVVNHHFYDGVVKSIQFEEFSIMYSSQNLTLSQSAYIDLKTSNWTQLSALVLTEDNRNWYFCWKYLHLGSTWQMSTSKTGKDVFFACPYRLKFHWH